MDKVKTIAEKLLFGSLFLLVIPVLLYLWADQTNDLIILPVPDKIIGGYILLLIGVTLIFAGIRDLWVKGEGLPMNPFPPRKFVKGGIYAILRHPIYTGAALITFSLSIIMRSASGFWLISPLFTLCIIGYVVGLENERIRTIFGPQQYKPFLSLPIKSSVPVKLTERISALLLVFFALLFVRMYFQRLDFGISSSVDTYSLPMNLKVREISMLFYLSGYLFITIIPFILKTAKDLRSFIIDVWLVVFTSGIIYFSSGLLSEHKSFVYSLPYENYNLIKWLTRIDELTLPYFYLSIVFVAINFLSISDKKTKSYGWLRVTLFSIISLSYIIIFNDSLTTLIAVIITSLIINHKSKIWNRVRKTAEEIANSWKEWRVGPVRIINHGFFGGAAGFTGMLLSGSFLGPQNSFAGFVVIIFMIIGAGLWAQLVEGSPKLLRPYGYYGGVIGLFLGSMVVWILFSVGFLTTLGSFAMAGPWIQAVGRLRCLVQGCCHGKLSNEDYGIRFVNPNSRVNKISGLKGEWLHPTQLYSIGCNLISGLILIRLFRLNMPCSFIVGMYLILNGIGRFIEESFRGEAQTAYLAGLRIYQWIAILNIIAGAIFTTLHYTATLNFRISIESILYALIAGVLTTIASGVDFPESGKRFARLTS